MSSQRCSGLCLAAEAQWGAEAENLPGNPPQLQRLHLPLEGEEAFLLFQQVSVQARCR